MFHVEIVYGHDIDARVYWAESPDMPGWSAAHIYLYDLMNIVGEAIDLYFPDVDPATVDVRHRWADDPSGTKPVIGVRQTLPPNSATSGV